MGEPLRAMTYNIRHAALDDGDAWAAHRRDGVVDIIDTHRPEVVALQEAGPTQLASLADRLQDYEWAGAGERTGEYNPIGYRPDRFELTGLEVRWLSETPAEVTTGWDAAFPRVATIGRLADEEGPPLTLLSVHLDNRGETAAVESARLLREWVAELDGPAVVAGDLNGPPRGPAHATLTDPGSSRPLRDARAVAAADHEGPEATFTGYVPPATGPRLDYLLVTADVAVCRHAICPDRDRTGRFPSDHLPVVADLRL